MMVSLPKYQCLQYCFYPSPSICFGCKSELIVVVCHSFATAIPVVVVRRRAMCTAGEIAAAAIG